MDVLKGITAIKQDDDAAFAKSIVLHYLGVILPIFAAVIISIIVTNIYGCHAKPQRPAVGESRNLFVIPKGTMVGDYRTAGDGLYLSGQTAARLVQKINNLEAAAAERMK